MAVMFAGELVVLYFGRLNGILGSNSLGFITSSDICCFFGVLFLGAVKLFLHERQYSGISEF